MPKINLIYFQTATLLISVFLLLSNWIHLDDTNEYLQNVNGSVYVKLVLFFVMLSEYMEVFSTLLLLIGNLLQIRVLYTPFIEWNVSFLN